MRLFDTDRVKQYISVVVPLPVQETAINLWREVGNRVDAIFRGTKTYAYKPPSDTQNPDILYLGSRDKFINPSSQQFLKTIGVFSPPALVGLRYAAPFTMGSYLPTGTIITALVGLLSFGAIIGFVRRQIAGNDLEKALKIIIQSGNPNATLETLPEASLNGQQIEMGNNSIGVVKESNTGHPEYIAFRYIKKVDGVDQIHTRVYAIGNRWINTGMTVHQNWHTDFTTSLEGRYIKRLINAAKNVPLDLPKRPAIPPRTMKDSWMGMVRVLTPDVFRQTISTLVKEALERIDASYFGKSVFSIAPKEKNRDLKFLSSRNRFINPTHQQLIKTVLLFSLPCWLSVRYLANLTLGPFIPLGAMLTSYVALYTLRKIAGAVRQCISGNDLQRALVAIVRNSVPSIVETPGTTVLDHLPVKSIDNNGRVEMGQSTVGVVKNDSRVTHVAFQYIDGIPGKEKTYTRLYYLGQGFISTRTKSSANKFEQIATSLESKYIEKLLEAAAAYQIVRQRELRNSSH